MSLRIEPDLDLWRLHSNLFLVFPKEVFSQGLPQSRLGAVRIGAWIR